MVKLVDNDIIDRHKGETAVVCAHGPTFKEHLGPILRLQQAKKVIIKQHEQSSKDYINISDVVRYLDLIADCGLRRSYNIASGTNTTHAQVAAWIQQKFSGTAVEFSSSPQPAVQFPSISIDRILSEFPPPAAPLQVA